MKDSIRTPLAKVRGLGSAKSGTSHFLWQRITAIILIPLTWWFIYSLLHIANGGSQELVIAWMASSANAAALIIMLMAVFYHAALGMQVIIEDYIHCPSIKLSSLLLNAVLMFAFAIISILAVLTLHFHMIPQGVAE